MKKIITLVTILTLSLTVIGQDSQFDYLNPELQKELKSIEQFNLHQNHKNYKSPETATIILDSVVGWNFDTLTNSWNTTDEIILTFHPNGKIKTWKMTTETFLNKTYYDVNGYQTTSENYVFDFGSWIKESKSEIAYDVDYNKLEVLLFIDNGGSWLLKYKENWTYDNQGNNLTFNRYQKIGSTWMDERKTESTYNSLGLEISTSNYVWINGVWLNQQKTEKGFDAQGNQLTEGYYHGDSNSWVGYYKWEKLYTSFNEEEMKLDYTWDSTQWKKSDSSWSTYNSNNLLIINTGYRWDDSAWVLYDLREISYDNNDNVILDFKKLWTGFSWRNSGKTVHTYNLDNQRILYAEYYWNYSGSYWGKSRKYEGYYDLNGIKMYGISYVGQDSTWLPNTKYVTDYDYNVPVEDIVHGGFFWGETTHQLLNQKFYYMRNNQWELGDSTTYYYSDIINGIESVGKFNMIVYPNPTIDILNIQGDFTSETGITVFDNTGRVVKETRFVGVNSQLDIRDLKSGIYYIRLHTGNELITRKIIKQ